MSISITARYLKSSGLGVKEIDFIIFATSTPDYYAPGSGCILQDKMNFIIEQSAHLQGVEMVNWILKYFGVNVTVQGQELIPSNGRNIFPANHPSGGLDGLSILSEILKIDTHTKFIVNDLLRVIKGLESLCIYIARFGNINRKNATEINEAFSSNINIILHPAGSVSK